MKKRLIIASNRLPIKIDKKNHNCTIQPSAGGLATGLKSYHKSNNSLWIGWPGISAENADDELKIEQLLLKEHCSPIYLHNQLIEDFYDGFSNSTLWPLFHYFTEYTEFKDRFWIAYKEVNQLFAEAILKQANSGDTVWVHDYQLLLVPEIIKSKRPELNVGFFLHIPFPSYEVFRILPWREEMLNGILGADLIGFHTYDYARHFLSSVKRLLGHDTEFNTISIDSRQVYVDVFPMGIDYEKFENKALELQSRPIQERSKQHQDIDRFLLDLPDRKLIFSSDRLDYTKGIPQRLKAFKKFLNDHPEYKEQVSLVLQIVPSREDVEHYQTLKHEIEVLVSSINGHFGTINWNPVIFFYRSLPFDNLVELFSSSDIALLTPLRDGMNLVAKEFIASKTNAKGVLILSEMAGATKELGEAILVNPNNINSVADAIYRALTMPQDEQNKAVLSMQKRIKRYNVFKWANEFIDALKKTDEKKAVNQARKVLPPIMEKLSAKYKNSDRRLLMLDYDGTLQKFFNNPEDAKPDKELISILQSLEKEKNTELVLISGRDKNTLNEWFGDKGYALIAEHGVWFKNVNEEWKERNQSEPEWKESIKPIIESYVDRTPGSLMEEKSHSIAWHYRKSDVELGALRALELTADISNLIQNTDLELLEGNKVIEIKISGINKGSAALDYINGNSYDYILAIGDDWTDEYLFKVLPNDAITIKVGTAKSEANYYVDNYKEVRKFLKSLIQ